MCCALLVAFRRQQRCLAVLQTQLDSLSSDIRKLEMAHEGLLVRFMNLPRSSGPSSDMLEEKTAAPTHPDEKDFKGSALYLVSPKTSLE